MTVWRLKNLIVALACMAIFACSRGSSPICVYGDDFGDVITKRIEMKAEGVPGTAQNTYVPKGWVDTGVDVTHMRSLQISTLGIIELCPTTEQETTVRVYPTTADWTPTNIRLGSNMKWQITSVTGSITDGPVNSNGTLPTTTNRYRGGERLYAYVGNFSNVTDKKNWFGTVTPVDQSYSSDYFFTEVAGVAQTPAPNPLMSQTVFRYSGKLYFRIYDHVGAMLTSQRWGMPENYANNTGYYDVKIKYTKSCQGTKGQFMQASIGNSGGIQGTVKDLSPYALGINGAPAGTFNDRAWATGRLWLRILDDSTKTDWGGFEGVPVGDGIYTPRTPSGSGSNLGTYFATIVTTKPFDESISNMINKLIGPVKEIMYGDPSSNDPNKYGLTKRMYLGLTGNVNFIAAIRSLLGLSIIFFALSYMLGLTKVDNNKFVMYMVKVGIVITLISPYSWSFFYENLFGLFIHGVEELVWIMSGQFADSVTTQDRFSVIKDIFVPNTSPDFSAIKDGIPVIYNGITGVIHGEAAQKLEPFFILSTDPSYSKIEGGLPIVMRGLDGKLVDPDTFQAAYNTEASQHAFAFLNQTLSRFFTKETNIKIVALLASFPLGIIFAILIYVGMFFFIVGVMRAVMMYMLSIIMTALLLFLAPIFISFLLFPMLRSLFDTYIKQLIAFSIQPVLMFMVLSLFNIFIYSIFYNLLSYSVCWNCIWHLDFPFNKWLGVEDNFDRFCIFEGYRPWGVSSTQELSTSLNKFPITIYGLLIFLIMGSAMDKFLDWINEFSIAITGGTGATALEGRDGGFASKMMAGAKNTAGAAFGQTIGQIKPLAGLVGRVTGVGQKKKDSKKR